MWQPIETAPKDRTILLTSRYCTNPCVCEWSGKEWRVLNEDGCAALDSQGDTWTEYATFSVPSHWQIVPNNPAFED